MNLEIARTLLQPPLHFGNENQILAVRYIEDCEKAQEALEKCQQEGHDHEREECSTCDGTGECECDKCNLAHECFACNGNGYEHGFVPPHGPREGCSFLKGLNQDAALEAFNIKEIG